MTSTGNKLDLALNGRGWFQVAGPNGETFYSRAGAFNKNATGQIVTGDGYIVQPAMTIPPNASEMTVNETGQVFVRIGTDTTHAADRPVRAGEFHQRSRPRGARR